MLVISIFDINIFPCMNSLVDHNAHFEELLNYFSSYLRDISGTISQVKSLAYMLIKVPPPNAKSIQINPDISSIMVACKRTFDDIKRVQSIVRGHVKGKEASPTVSRVSSNSKIGISANKLPNLKLQLQNLDIEPQFTVQSAKDLTSTPYKSAIQQKYSPFQIQQQTKSTRITNNFPLKEDIKNKQIQLSRSQSANTKNIEAKIESIRESRNRDLKGFVSENQDCLSLIKKIRDELRIKKRK